MYSTKQLLQFTYGKVTVEDWADVDASGAIEDIDARIEWAIKKADRYIDSKLLRRNFKLPFDPVPEIIADISAELAGFYLYSGRMLDGSDKNRNNLMHVKRNVDYILSEIVLGKIKLDNTLQDFTDAPSVQK